MDKKSLKRQNHCLVCEEENYCLLDVHRINPGSEGGKYTDWNSVVLCSNCHRKVHAKKIEIKGSYMTTNGKKVCYIIDGEEYWR